MEIQTWPIEKLVIYARNPRKNDAAVDRMCGSIHEFGFKIPCLVRSDGEVIDGHLRLKAARKLGLAAEPRHGYGIMREVARQSDGQYQMGPGTLYDNLQKLMNQGLVEEAPHRSADDDPRRRYYCLTRFGRRVLEADIVRLKRVVREASFRLRERHPRRI